MTESAASPSRHESGGRPTVVVFDPVPGASTWGPETAILGSRGVDLVVPGDAAEADEAIRTADAVIVTGYGRLDADRVAGLERAVGILCYSIGMDKVDGPAAAAAGIPVRNVPDYCTDEVSDHALALLLAAERRILPFATATAAGGWPNDDRSITGSLRRLRGQTLGIAGAGRIGRLVAAKARAFGFRTIAFDPFISVSADPDLPLVDRDELFAAVGRDHRGRRLHTGCPAAHLARGAGGASSRASSSSTSRVAVTSTSTRSPRRWATAGSPSRHSTSARKSRPTPPTIP